MQHHFRKPCCSQRLLLCIKSNNYHSQPLNNNNKNHFLAIDIYKFDQVNRSSLSLSQSCEEPLPYYSIINSLSTGPGTTKYKASK